MQRGRSFLVGAHMVYASGLAAFLSSYTNSYPMVLSSADDTTNHSNSTSNITGMTISQTITPQPHRHHSLPLSSFTLSSLQPSIPSSAVNPPQALWVLEYDCRSKNPKWAYEFLKRPQPSDRTTSRYKSSFFPEPLLPEAFQIRPKDYANSGFDRFSLSLQASQ
jgi:hypothetical protein